MNPASLINISLTWEIKSESVKQDERLRKGTYPVGPKRYSPLRNVKYVVKLDWNHFKLSNIRNSKF